MDCGNVCIPRPGLEHRMNEKLLDEILQRIISVAHPEKIILFGSRAREDAKESSDLDLLVVKSGANRRETAQNTYQNLVGIEMNVDVIVATPEDLEKYKDASVLVYSAALKDGKVVYAA